MRGVWSRGLFDLACLGGEVAADALLRGIIGDAPCSIPDCGARIETSSADKCGYSTLC
jgi:hypothetical protein